MLYASSSRHRIPRAVHMLHILPPRPRGHGRSCLRVVNQHGGPVSHGGVFPENGVGDLVLGKTLPRENGLVERREEAAMIRASPPATTSPTMALERSTRCTAPSRCTRGAALG